MNTEAEFKKELQDLLRKYNVEVSVENGYSDPKVNFYRHPKYDTDGNEIVEYINWNVRYLNSMSGDSE